jgi:hypothetical protein
MRKFMALGILAIVSPSCQACMYGTAAKLNDISVGMTKAETIEKIGEPDTTYVESGAEFMIYKWMKTTISWAPKHYYVKLVDGKVEAYGEEKDRRDDKQ